MNYKIIETEANCPDLLLFRGTTVDVGDVCVTIYCIGYAGQEEQTEIEEVLFDSPESAERFIDDYSIISATKWCQLRELTYSPAS